MHHADVILAVGARFDDRGDQRPVEVLPERQDHPYRHRPGIDLQDHQGRRAYRCPVESVLTEMVATLKEIGETPNKESVASWWKQIDEWRGRSRPVPL